MRLCKAGGAHYRSERLEQGVDRAAQRALHFRPRECAVEGRQLILEAREIRRHLVAEYVGPRRQKLTKLDGRRAELFERPRQALSRAATLCLRTAEQAQDRGGPTHFRRKQGRELPRNQRIGPDQHPARADQAAKGRQRHRHPPRLRAPSRGAALRRRR